MLATQRCAIAVALAVSAGCSAASSAIEKEPGPVDSMTPSVAESGAAELETLTLEPLSAMGFSADGTLVVARVDGSLTTWTPGEGSRTWLGPSTPPSPILAWSPDRSLALVDATPPRIISLENSSELHRFPDAYEIEDANFLPDSSGFFVAEPRGRVRIWRTPLSLLKKQASRDLRDFMARQDADITAEFHSVSGAIATIKPAVLLLGTTSGTLYWWDLTRGDLVDGRLRMPAAVVDTAIHGDHIFATSADGAFRAADRTRGSFLRWSIGLRADWVATSDALEHRVAIARDGHLAMLRTADGRVIWDKPLPKGSATCGLSLTSDGELGAVCVDAKITIFRVGDGSVVHTLP